MSRRHGSYRRAAPLLLLLGGLGCSSEPAGGNRDDAGAGRPRARPPATATGGSEHQGTSDAGSGGGGFGGQPSAGSGGDDPGAAGGDPGAGGDGLGTGADENTGAPLIEPAPREDAMCGVAPGGSEEGSHVLRFENAETGFKVQIRRVYLAPGIGSSRLYGMSDMALVLDGRTHCSGDLGDIEPLSYESTHHNWRDRALGTVDGVRYELYLGLEFTEEDIGGWAPTLSGFDAETGELVLEPIPLVATGGPRSCWTCPSSMSVVISEVMAHNEATLADEEGEYDPWIELYNSTSRAIDLAGYTLSNDLRDRDRWTFPSVTLPPKGYLVVFADGQSEQGDLHTNFVLSGEGDAVVLAHPSGRSNGGIAFGAQEPDASFAFSWTAGDYVSVAEPTPGARSLGLE